MQISDPLSSESEQLDYEPSPSPPPAEERAPEEEEKEEEEEEVSLLPRRKRRKTEEGPPFDLSHLPAEEFQFFASNERR